jgi:hypothetical protein
MCLIVGLFFGLGWSAPEEANAAAGDVIVASDLVKDDIIYYGNYPQTDLGQVETAPVPSGTRGVDYVIQSTDGAYSGVKRDDDHYFKIEPIAWRVLENANNQLFLLADKAIDRKQFNESNVPGRTWEMCTARSWLNGYDASKNTNSKDFSAAGENFIGDAFTSAEQAKIASTDVDNTDNTADKIFYLKLDDATNANYFTNDNSRIAQATDYTVALGAMGSGNAIWWLRSPVNGVDVKEVSFDGTFHDSNVNTTYVAVRPAFYLETSGVIFRETSTPNEYQASIPNTDATLSNLSVSSGALSPAFASATTSYDVSVPNATSSITLTATTTDANATVTGDGVKSLKVGANKFKITVTAEDTSVTKDYTVTVTRAAPDKTALKSDLDAANSVKNASKTQEYTDSADFAAMLNALATGENVYANTELQSEADSAAKEITDALAVLGYGKVVDYGFEDGDSDYTKGGTAGLKHRTEKDLGLHNAVVKVDGARITDCEDYTAVHGSTVVQLKTAYLDTLANGSHKLVVEFVDGKNSESEFTVLAADSDVDDDDDDSGADGEDENNDSDGSEITSQPKTGDDISALWLVNLLASAALISLLMVLLIRRKTRME